MLKPSPFDYQLDPVIIEFLHSTGLAENGDIEAEPLTGGVASDIWKIRTGSSVFVVKRALARLRVAQEWNAPVSRNASEVEWLIEAGKVVRGAVPEILAHDAERGVFAMSFLDPADHPVWKSELRLGHITPDFASMLGRTLAAIHNATANSDDVARRFANDDVFHSIRLEPYIEATARVHSDLAEQLVMLSRDTLSQKSALVHGDISPKNILVGPKGPVILDAECAWYGDPAFDIAFCLNHLLLKCLWIPAYRDAYRSCFKSLASSYFANAGWENTAELERRAARLLPALLLARIDGKSPVEYITCDDDKNRVRTVARKLIASAPPKLADIEYEWFKELSAYD
jgi:fructosamine-3-kinase